MLKYTYVSNDTNVMVTFLVRKLLCCNKDFINSGEQMSVILNLFHKFCLVA